MPSDPIRDKVVSWLLVSGPHDYVESDDDVNELIDLYNEARAEGYRDGLERAARVALAQCATHTAAAIRALAPVPDSHRESVEEWATRLGKEAAENVPPEDAPTGAKATDPRGSRETGGEDATEWVPPQGSVGSVVETARRLVHGRAWLRAGEPELVKVDPGTFGALVDAVVALDKKCGA